MEPFTVNKPTIIKQGDTESVSLEITDSETGEPYDFTGCVVTSNVVDSNNVAETPVISLSSDLGTITLGTGSATYSLAAATIAVGSYVQDFKVSYGGESQTWWEREIRITK